MPTTPFFVASFNGQTANGDLASYVPQTGDLNASFSRASYSTASSSGGIQFHSTLGALKEIGSASGVSDYTYQVAKLPDQDQNDLSLDFIFGAAPTSATQVHGFTLGDNNSTSRVNVYLTNDTGQNKLFIENNVSGTKTTLASSANLSFAANSTYTLLVQVRGKAGALTISVLYGPKGGAMTLVHDTIAIPSMVMAGRSVGIRMAATAANTQEANGVFIDAASAGAYSSAVTTAQSGTTVGSAVVTATPPAGATGAVSYQFQRAPDAGGVPGTFANVGTAGASTTFNDTGLTVGTAVWYRSIATDSASTPVVTTAAAISFTPPVPDFSISTAPASMALRQGEALPLTVSGVQVAGYTGAPNLTVTGLSQGVTASFGAASLTNGAGSSVLTISAAGNALTGAVEIVVSASDGTIIRTAPVLLQVNPPSGVVYPVVSSVLPDDLVTITRGGTTEQVAAAALKAYLAG